MFMAGLMLACAALSKLTACVSPFRLVGAPRQPYPTRPLRRGRPAAPGGATGADARRGAQAWAWRCGCWAPSSPGRARTTARSCSRACSWAPVRPARRPALPPAGAAAAARRCTRAARCEGAAWLRGPRRGRRRGVADDAVGAVRGRRGAAEAEGVLVLAALPVPQRGRGRRCAAPRAARPLPWLVQSPAPLGAAPASARLRRLGLQPSRLPALACQPAAPAGGSMPSAV
jgi:hypothetical protein